MGNLIAFLLAVLRNTHVSEALTAVAWVVSESIATLYVWFVIPSEGDVSRAWYTGRFSDYFKARLIAWSVVAAAASFIYWIRYKRGPKQSSVPEAQIVGARGNTATEKNLANW